MASGLLAGLGKLVQVGAAYVQHVNFANQVLAAPTTDRPRQLQAYAQGLTEASFAGLKVTLAMLVNQEQDALRKSGLQQLIDSADAARRGAVPPVPQATQAISHTATFESDLDRVAGWYDQLDGPDRERALLSHVATLTADGHRRFTAHLQQMIDNVGTRIEQHAAHEHRAWGGSIEDRIAYGMARLQTGQRDPAWQRQMHTLQDVRAFFQAVLAATQQLWTQRQGRSTMNTPSPAPRPDPKTVLANVQNLVRTGQYPGGAEKMQADIAALVLAGQADEVMEALKAMGAMDVGSKTLVIEDHYVDGPQPYTLRWPVKFPLPFPFEELPRKTQFSVLFGEWTRREMEGSYAMSQGQNDEARAAYQECLERAQQIAVPELVARSHEGLARLASKLNDRALERQHLKAAIAARAG